MISKEKLLESLKDLPDSFSMEELLDRILLFEKIEIGLNQSNLGQAKSTAEVREELKKWLK